MKDFGMQWHDPDSEMPPNGVPVIAAVINEYGYVRRIRAQHVSQHTVSLHRLMPITIAVLEGR